MNQGLEVRDLDVNYTTPSGIIRAVQQVSLQIQPGQIVSLLGSSGCGKSSLLRAVAGLEDVAGGTITWDGDDVVATAVHQRGFGLMFQDGQLFPHRDVAGNIAYGLRARLPQSEWPARISQMLELVGLPGYEHRRITTLSGGQAQRVALARALAPAPRLLLLDEPLSALDRSLRESLSGELRTILQAQNTAALYVTHDQDEAMTVGDQVGVMESGRLLRLATPSELWAAPQARSVAEFLGFTVLPDAACKQLGVGPCAVGPGGFRISEAGALLGQISGVYMRRGVPEIAVTLDSGSVVSVTAAQGSVGERVRLDVDPQRLVSLSQ